MEDWKGGMEMDWRSFQKRIGFVTATFEHEMKIG